MRRFCTALMVSLLGLAAMPEHAAADAAWQQSSKVWKAMDQCTRAAQKAFPDYTREGKAKREAFRRHCLRQANLPADDDARPEPPPQPR